VFCSFVLAFHTFGPPGKTVVELCIIGFLMGTCIAFFVVVGDLGPAIIAKSLNVSNTANLRQIVLIGMLLLQYCSSCLFMQK
jgi:sodium-coupled neutral amino acid transporter 10